jgi:transposase
MVNRGGEIWGGDETTLREVPPLRAAWALIGVQAVVPLTGRNPRRVLVGGLNLQTGELVTVTRDRCRGEDVVAFVEALGRVRPAVPKLLIWDNAPAHKTRAVRAALAAAHIEVAWLPFRSPELNPLEDLWRHLKAYVAANRVYETVATLAAAAVGWLDGLTNHDRLRKAALLSAKFNWLPT